MPISYAERVENELFGRHPQIAIPLITDDHEGITSENVGRWLIAAYARKLPPRQAADRLASKIESAGSRWPIN